MNNVCVFLCFVCLNIYRPSSIIKYSNMTPRLSGHISVFGLVFFVLWSLLRIARQWSYEQFAILSMKPWSHFGILTYGMWSIDDITGVTRDVVPHWHLPEC